ncbi:MAG: FAD-binding oxidoreductase [Pseudomonadota bacterium]
MVNVLYANDRLGEYPDSYYAATAPMLEPFPSLQGEVRVDVCVIGAGFSGLSAALHLKKRGFDVALLDAHRIGWGASGRNGGQVGTGQRLQQDALTKLVGDDHARALWDVSQGAKALVSQLINDLNIECDYRSGILYTDHKKAYSEDTKRYVDFMRNEYDYKDITYLDRDAVRSVLATEAYHSGTYDTGGRHLHPLKFALGLARGCAESGVRIFEKSEVKEISEGAPARVTTQNGELTADTIVLAANGYLGGLNRRAANRIIPINNYIVATEPLAPETASSLIANGAAVADSKFVINYYRLSEDHRLLFGGRESYRYRFPTDIKSFVREAMLSIYPQLEDTQIDYGWGGTLALTMNRMPYFEFLSPNMVTIGGYSGHGVMMATMGGALAAEAVGGVMERFDVMARVPTQPIPGGVHARLPLLTLGMAFYSLRDRL